MKEKVAMALRTAMPGLSFPDAWNWETLAIAAIAAMRTPSLGMLDAGNRAVAKSLALTDNADVCWQAMIDEALK